MDALEAIARAVDEGGDADTAYAALRRADPLLRGRLRRTIRDASVDAAVATRFRSGPDGELHVLRLTYLLIAHAPFDREKIDDPEAIADAFKRARAAEKPARRFWWATTILAGVIALATAAAAFAVYRATRPPRRLDASDRLAPPAAGAYLEGGRPLPGDPLLVRTLSRDLPDYLIALDRRMDAERTSAGPEVLARTEATLEAAKAKLMGDDVARAFGPGPFARFRELVDKARSAADSKTSHEASSKEMLEATGAFDDALASAGLAYFVDGDVIRDLRNDRRMAIVYSFNVSHVTIFRAGDATIRALDVRRIDNLNLVHALLGFTRPQIRDAVVLLDQIDEELVSYVIPSLAPRASTRLFDEDDDSVPVRAEVERRAAEVLRSDYEHAAGLDLVAAERMGALLGRRSEMFAKWRKMVKERGLYLSDPPRLQLDPDWKKELGSIIAGPDLEAVGKIDSELGEDAILDAYEKIRAMLVDSVERHETQHRIDYALPEVRRMPAELAKYVGDSARQGDGADHARAELSAYLAELARDDRTTLANLTLVSRHLFSRRLQGAPESYAALIIVEGLVKELGIDKPSPLVVARSIDRAAASAVYLALTARKPAEVRDAAKRLWERLFEDKLVKLEKR